MKASITPVILCGGSGSRLWPLSRKQSPKQFIALENEQSLLQNTLDRLAPFHELCSPLLVCHEALRFQLMDQIKGHADHSDILLEPVSRNTAPATCIAAYHAAQTNPEQVLWLLPSDHVMDWPSDFSATLQAAYRSAMANYLVTFGIQPTHPETGYGYIQSGQQLTEGVYTVKQFLEKPDRVQAERFIQQNNCFWNSGQFMFKASAFLDALEQFEPDMLNSCERAYANGHEQNQCYYISPTHYAQCPSNSIDYAVMEKTQNAVVLPLKTQWRDIGSWSSVWAMKPADAHSNVCQGDVSLTNVKRCYIRSDKRLIAASGVSDLAIIDTDDALLVTHLNNTQSVKQLVETLDQSSRSEVDTHTLVYRPWGHYKTIDQGEGYLVKQIVVNPEAKISLQKHYHRAEHWTVVQGQADVICNDKAYSLNANESTYIPVGAIHRMSNNQSDPLVVIEVQTGQYISEADIERIEDIYARVQEKAPSDS